MKQGLAFAAKAAVSALLLYLALRSIDFGQLTARLARIDLTWCGTALLVLTVQILLVAVRWREIARACGATLGARDGALFTFIGMFFNQTLPSTVGGDAARIWLLARSGGGWRNAAYSVLIDRAAGLIWLAIIVLACLPWSLRLIENPVGRITLALIGLGGIAGPVLLRGTTQIAGTLLSRWRAARHLVQITDTMWRVLVSPRAGTMIGALSIAIHLSTVLAVWLIAGALGAALDIGQAVLLIPPVVLVAAIPISIAGWGVREGAMIAAFAYAGLPDGDAVSISITFGVANFIIGAAGGLVWILSGRTVKFQNDGV